MRKRQKTSQLREKLRPYGLADPTSLAAAIGTSRQYAHVLLAGQRIYGVKMARRIAHATGLPVGLIIEWQENGR
jgi:transcriptional regulator with XRE-family HTH domain